MSREYNRQCIICGKMFTTASHNKKICKNPHILKCPHCGKIVRWYGTGQFKGCKTCNYKLAVDKRKKTMLNKYGAETTMQSDMLWNKAKNTMINKFGVDNPMKSDKIRHEAEKTNLARYGVINPMQNHEIAKKSRDTRYEHIDLISQKIRNTWCEKYGADNCRNSSEIINKIKGIILTKCGDHSKIVQNFSDRLNSYSIKHELSYKLESESYDIHIIDTNILVKINPTYSYNIAEDCRIYKTILAEKHGYRCIHVYDWDDVNRIIGILQPIKYKISAHKCKIFKLHKWIGDDFLNKYHLQGSCRGQLLYLGLVYGGILLQIMTFGKSRYNKKYDVELMRMCTLPGYCIVGGASKLFSYATKDFGLQNIITYCDKSKFVGNVYNKIGMQYSHTVSPQIVWSKDDKYITSNMLYRYGNKLFDIENDKDVVLSVIKNDWLPIYDCGKDVYVFTQK